MVFLLTLITFLFNTSAFAQSPEPFDYDSIQKQCEQESAAIPQEAAARPHDGKAWNAPGMQPPGNPDVEIRKAIKELTQLLMRDEKTRVDGIVYIAPSLNGEITIQIDTAQAFHHLPYFVFPEYQGFRVNVHASGAVYAGGGPPPGTPPVQIGTSDIEEYVIRTLGNVVSVKALQNDKTVTLSLLLLEGADKGAAKHKLGSVILGEISIQSIETLWPSEIKNIAGTPVRDIPANVLAKIQTDEQEDFGNYLQSVPIGMPVRIVAKLSSSVIGSSTGPVSEETNQMLIRRIQPLATLASSLQAIALTNSRGKLIVYGPVDAVIAILKMDTDHQDLNLIDVFYQDAKFYPF